MSAVADWAEEHDEAGGDVDTTPPPATPAGRHVIGVDVDAEVSESVAQAVRNGVRKYLAGIAAEAVATILNEDTVAALQARALQAADQAVQEELNADTASAQRDFEADGDEEPAVETLYGNVDEFVRAFLVVTYRREVSRQGTYKWDARWWMHPEAVARLDALSRVILATAGQLKRSDGRVMASSPVPSARSRQGVERIVCFARLWPIEEPRVSGEPAAAREPSR